MTRANDGGPKHLVVIRDCAVAMMLFQAPRTMDLLGREILRAIQRKEIIIIQEAKLLQIISAGDSREDISKGGSELFEVDRIEDFSHASVAGYLFHTEDHLQVLFVSLPALVECQHGGILKSKHGETAHECIWQLDGWDSRSRSGNVLERFMDRAKQRVGGKMFSRGRCFGHSHSFFHGWQTAFSCG